MTIEYAIAQVKQKPWGSVDLHPWSMALTTGGPIGELWFCRTDDTAPYTGLLLKLLFTTKPLSIQVHPDDALARSIGLANGKTEAWYILSAVPGAKVAVGLSYARSPAELRLAIADGSIANIVHWHPVSRGDVIFVPVGTIHAIGAGVVLAEIPQRSDATFRLFDGGRQRELHIVNAVKAARTGPVGSQSPPKQINHARTALVVNSHFVLEHVDLLPGSVWAVDALNQTRILAIEGHAQLGSIRLSLGEAAFVEPDHATIEVGTSGLKALLAYTGPNVNPDALKDLSDRRIGVPPASSYSPAIQTSSEHSALSERGTPTWPL